MNDQEGQHSSGLVNGLRRLRRSRLAAFLQKDNTESVSIQLNEDIDAEALVSEKIFT
jgi:hypothetical protein